MAPGAIIDGRDKVCHIQQTDVYHHRMIGNNENASHSRIYLEKMKVWLLFERL